jgi:hypothetical protein
VRWSEFFYVVNKWFENACLFFSQINDIDCD